MTKQMMKEETLATIRRLIEEQVIELKNRVQAIDGIRTDQVVCLWPDNLLTVALEGNRACVSARGIAQTFVPEHARHICKTVMNGHGDSPITMSELDYCRVKIAKLTCQLNETTRPVELGQ